MISEAFYAIVLDAVKEALDHPAFVANEALGRKLLQAPLKADVIVTAVLAQLPPDAHRSINQAGMRCSLRATIERAIIVLPYLEKQAKNTQQPLEGIIAKLVMQAGQPYLKKCA